ncbi:Peroxisome chaperone and import receptor [Actinomortierella ambigua]|uniref:Peroxisome chaperone and import receptor n=1 Tax=Actinomortierella ambigua TaxID=1343610 RepID=A0A9P6UCI9_9FUNG|nr:Peroxisome chaperone and import receptor [Actinomortierella ambigua]KAG0269353.1 Peroxisome chaperone and import receptor [Actinomortierella ambigua]
MPETTKKPTVVDEEVDDDFLDGALDGFVSPKPAAPAKPASTKKAETSTSKAAASSDKPARTPESILFNPDEDDEDGMDPNDEFTKQLAAGMEDLMKEMSGNQELQKSFEEMFKNLDVAGAGAPGSPSPSSPAAGGDKAAGGSFQDRIAKTMDKLKDSSEQADAKAAEDSEEALMAEMMRQMEGLAEGGDFQNVLEGMMEQLMSKDILYEPMQDLAQKYPKWLEDNKSKISEEEYTRYEKQYQYVKEIVEFFERPDFDDKSETQAKSVIELMQGMQDCGQPPADILDELAPGLEMGPDGTPNIPEMPDCNMQ